MHHRNRVLIAIAILVFLTVGQIMAQSDESHSGNISENDTFDRYTISLNEGDSVVIVAEASSGSDLDTYLYLLDDDDNVLEENDDFDGTNSQIEFTASDAGEYSIAVSNYPDTFGEYDLSIVYSLAEGVSSEGSASQEGLEVSGFADDDNFGVYEIELGVGQSVVIVAEASSGSELDTVLFVRNASGEDVAENDDFDGTNSQIDFTADEAGTYTVLVGAYPGTSGDYDLSVTYGEGGSSAGNTSSSSSSSNATFNTTPDRVPDEEYTGNTNNGAATYTVQLEVGDGVIGALYNTDGAMDSVLYATDPNGTELVYNDDRSDYQTLDSQVAFVAQTSGTHTFYVTNITGLAGAYRLEIYLVDAQQVLFAEQATRVSFSGEELLYDTENFRIHYTQEGDDASTTEYVELVAATVEEVLTLQTEFGWVAPPSDIVQGGDARYDVYLVNQDEGTYGYANSSSASGDNENSAMREENAQAGFLVLDNDYSEFDDDQLRSLLATTAHEFHHVVQFGYKRTDLSWYYESTASWVETTTYPEQELATIYVESAFGYPEACIGGEGDASLVANQIYGTWLFFDFMAGDLGADAPLTLWDNIATREGWESLEVTLANYSQNVPDYFARYHVNNLVRNYDLIESFGSQTVWLEQNITEAGDWSPTGMGIQELGANYMVVNASGVYNFSVANDNLALYFVGIDGDAGSVYSLGRNGSVDTSSYDHAYIMVVNTNYDDDVAECVFTEYTISVIEGGDIADVSYEVDASNFRELGN